MYVRKQHWSQLIYDLLNMFLTLLCCILLSIFLQHLKYKYTKFKIHKQANKMEGDGDRMWNKQEWMKRRQKFKLIIMINCTIGLWESYKNKLFFELLSNKKENWSWREKTGLQIHKNIRFVILSTTFNVLD